MSFKNPNKLKKKPVKKAASKSAAQMKTDPEKPVSDQNKPKPKGNTMK